MRISKGIRMMAILLLLALTVSMVGCTDTPASSGTSTVPTGDGTGTTASTSMGVAETTATTTAVGTESPSQTTGIQPTTAQGSSTSKTNAPTEPTQGTTALPAGDSHASGYTADLLRPMSGPIDSDVAKMRDRLTNTKDTLNITGTKYYVSNNGNDSNSGKSPDKAWKTLMKVSLLMDSGRFKAGDAILFERGSIFRGNLRITVSGITLAAYGSGKKPCIYGATKNTATSKWVSAGTNLWTCEDVFAKDVGVIVFDHGKQVAYKQDKKSQANKDYTFWYDSATGKVYVYLTAGNPATVFKDIEVCENQHIISAHGCDNLVFDNLCVKYGGAHAFQMSEITGFTVTNCEIGWIGGSYLSGKLRFGNAIEVVNKAENMHIAHNYIYQIYDTGITYQYGSIQKNIMIKDNLVERCAWAVEVLTNEDGLAENVTFDGNYLRLSGFGFGTRPDSGSYTAIQFWDAQGPQKNIVFKNNVIDRSAAALMKLCYKPGQAPKFENNTYIQQKGRYFATILTERLKFDDQVSTLIANELGDKTGKVIFT